MFQRSYENYKLNSTGKLHVKFFLYLLIILDWTVLNGFELLINCCSICHIFMPTLNQGGAATDATLGTDGTAAVGARPIAILIEK
jgi:hypothetical protein